MTLYDSSVLIDYLDGDAATLTYVDDHLDERAVTIPLVMFEVYQGEVFKSGPADFGAVDEALEWVTVVDESADLARAAGEFQEELQKSGQLLTARDAYIAGAAKRLGEPLVVGDSDFEGDAVTEVIDVDFV